jgi:restriction endonuclease S subunit
MWIGRARWSDLQERACWKVEFFDDELPQSQTVFPLYSLNDLVEERRETVDPQADPSKLLNYLSLENVQSVTGNLIDFRPRLGREIKSRSKIFRAGDVLYGRLRPYLNKVYVADDPVSSGICSGEFYVLIPKRNLVLPHFLRTLLASSYVHQYVSKLHTGSALPRLQLHNLLAAKVPIPPIEQQAEFEKFLILQAELHRKLAIELAELPQKTLDRFTHSLKTGELIQHHGDSALSAS